MQKMILDLRFIGRVIINRRLLITNIFIATISIVVLINFLIPPTFESEVTLQVKPAKGLLSNSISSEMMGTSANSKLMSTYSEILRSRTVIKEVIDKTQADKDEMPSYGEMIKRITMQPIKDTDIVKIKATANSPDEAQLVASTLVDSFINRLAYLAHAEKNAVRELMLQRVVESRKELDRCEDALEKYKRDQKILTPSDDTKAMVGRMASMKSMLADNTVSSAVANAKLRNVESQLVQEVPGIVADSTLIQFYKSKLSELQVELVNLSQNYGEKHPKVIANRALTNEIRVKLDNEVAKVIHNEAASLNPIHQGLLQTKMQNEAELAAAAAQRAAIQRVMAESEKEVSTLPAKEQGISRLIRDVMVAQEIYVMLAKRSEEARLSEIAQPSEIQVIDVAASPSVAIYPRKILNLLIGAIVGFISGLGLAIFLENARRTIDNSQGAKECLHLPILGIIPDFNLEKLSSPSSFIERLQMLFHKMPNFIIRK